MAGITNKTISKLFGLAAGRCSICKIAVVEQDVKIGEMAHIIAKRKGGARSGLSLQGNINGYENLILLCPNHHTEVDANEAAYPPERLHQLKNEHETYVSQIFTHKSQGRAMDIAGLQALMRFLPFTQISALTNGLPISFNMDFFYVDEVCENFGKDFPQCRPFSDQYLENYFVSFWQHARDLCDYVHGTYYGEKKLYDSSEQTGVSPNYIYLNRDLNYDEVQTAKRDINTLVSNLNSSHYAFLRYIKNNYLEVNLAPFAG